MNLSRYSKHLPSFLIGIGLLGAFLFIRYGHYKYHHSKTIIVRRHRVSASKFDLVEEDKDKPVILLWGRKFQGSARYWNEYPSVQKIRRGDILTNNIFKGVRQTDQCCEGVEITANKSYVERATAIVIFHQQIKYSGFPKVRKPKQLWVLYNKESPVHSADLTQYNGWFNWTMNYRTDSDAPVPYGDYTKLDVPQHEIHINGVHIDEWISKKRELLAGVMSNCKTPGKRENFVKALVNEGNITVDIYGKCGVPFFNRFDFKCSFWNDLAQEYKFFLAAENSLCSDYVTEKFWRSLEIGMVPVAYGGADYEKLAPPGSFIDARKFESAKELAEYLVTLDRNTEEYKKFFEWRKIYEVQAVQPWHDWCGLCKAVKEFKEKVDRFPDHPEEYSQSLNNLGEWWKRKAPPSTENACVEPLYK